MDLRIIGCRIKEIREKKNLTQEELADLAEISPTHISVIERGVKVPKLDTFIAIANALDVSADELLVGIVNCSVLGVANQLSETLSKLPNCEQKKILDAIRILIDE